MKHTAWAVTASNSLGCGPGITVSKYDSLGGPTTEVTIPADPGVNCYGDLNTGEADALLWSHGFMRVSSWEQVHNTGLWSAPVAEL
jgi:hypothetical protein